MSFGRGEATVANWCGGGRYFRILRDNRDLNLTAFGTLLRAL